LEEGAILFYIIFGGAALFDFDASFFNSLGSKMKGPPRVALAGLLRVYYIIYLG
jgi:hypothetical protein